MDIFINGEKVDLEIKTKKLITILEKIESKFLSRGDIIIELKIDGVSVAPDSLPLNKNIRILELKTRTHREVLIESLYLFETFVNKFYDSYKEMEDEKGDVGTIFEMVSFIEWCLGVLLSIKEATKIDLIYSDFDKYLNDFRKYSEEVFEAFRNEKYLQVMETFDGVVLDLVENLHINSKDYLKEILKEEAFKNMPN